MKLYHITVPGNALDPEAAEKEAKRVHKVSVENGLDASLSRGFGVDDSIIVVRSESEIVTVDGYAAVLVSDEGGTDVGTAQRKSGSRGTDGNTDNAADAPNE